MSYHLVLLLAPSSFLLLLHTDIVIQYIAVNSPVLQSSHGETEIWEAAGQHEFYRSVGEMFSPLSVPLCSIVNIRAESGR